MLYFNIQRTKKYNYLTLPTLQKCDLYQKSVFLTKLKSFSALKHICKIFGKSRYISDFAFPDFLEILYMKIFGKSGIINILRSLGFQILSIDWPNSAKVAIFCFLRSPDSSYLYMCFIYLAKSGKRNQISYFALARFLYVLMCSPKDGRFHILHLPGTFIIYVIGTFGKKMA